MHHEEQFCEIILNLGQWLRRSLKYVLSRALAVLQNHYANLKEGIMENIHVKLYGNWTSGSEGVVKRHFISRALAGSLFSGLEPFVQFG